MLDENQRTKAKIVLVRDIAHAYAGPYWVSLFISVGPRSRGAPSSSPSRLMLTHYVSRARYGRPLRPTQQGILIQCGSRTRRELSWAANRKRQLSVLIATRTAASHSRGRSISTIGWITRRSRGEILNKKGTTAKVQNPKFVIIEYCS